MRLIRLLWAMRGTLGDIKMLPETIDDTQRRLFLRLQSELSNQYYSAEHDRARAQDLIYHLYCDFPDLAQQFGKDKLRAIAQTEQTQREAILGRTLNSEHIKEST